MTTPSTTSPSATAATVSADVSTASSADELVDGDPRVNEWALDYVGGTSGVAAGDPFRIGFASGTASDFEEANAAIEYLNQELGGVGGRPLELEICDASAAASEVEQPALIMPCGVRLASDPSVHMLLIGDLYTLDTVFTDVVGASMPIYVDYGYQNVGVSYNPNGVETLAAAAFWIARDFEPRFSRLIAIDPVDVSGMIQPVLPNMSIVAVPFNHFEGTTVADAVDLIAASGATSDDLFFIQADCSQIIEALNTLQLTPTVVAGGGCNEGLPDGWFKVNLGGNPDIPKLETGALTASTKLQQYLGEAPRRLNIFADILTVAKIINQVGVGQATSQKLREALYEFTGTAILGVGPVDCAGSTALNLPTLGNCATTVDAFERRNGTWVELDPIVVDAPRSRAP